MAHESTPNEQVAFNMVVGVTCFVAVMFVTAVMVATLT